MTTCLIALGANLGDKRATLGEAVLQLAAANLTVRAASQWYSYPAVGGPSGQGDFLNGVVVCETDYSPQQIADALQAIERRLGRTRSQRWDARTLDCDLLLYGNETITTPTLVVPHPRMITRRFVLEPAVEVAPDLVHPIHGRTLRQLFEHLRDALPYFTVLGTDLELVDKVAAHVAQQLAGELLQFDAIRGDGGSRPAIFPGPRLDIALEWGKLLGGLLKGSDFFRKSSASPKNDLSAANDRMDWVAERVGARNQHLDGSGARSVLVSNFWFWEVLLDANEEVRLAIRQQLAPHHPGLEPKLLMVTDPRGSRFSRKLESISATCRPPILYLSERTEDALQDAAGAVAAMQ